MRWLVYLFSDNSRKPESKKIKRIHDSEGKQYKEKEPNEKHTSLKEKVIEEISSCKDEQKSAGGLDASVAYVTNGRVILYKGNISNGIFLIK